MPKAAAQGWRAALVYPRPPTRASPCLQPRRLLQASLAPASPLQQVHVRAQGGCREVTAAQGQAGTGRHCCTGSQATPAPANNEHQAALDLRRMHPGTQMPVPADAPAPPAPPLLPCRAPDPLSHPLAAEHAGHVAERGCPPPHTSGSMHLPDSQVFLLFTVFTDRL